MKRHLPGIVAAAMVLVLVFGVFPLAEKAFAHDPGLYDRRGMSTVKLPTPTHGYLAHGVVPAVYLSERGVDVARNEAQAGVGALAGYLCSRIPKVVRHAVATCTVVVSVHFYRIKRVLDTASNRGQCVRARVFSAVLIKLDRVTCTRG